MEKSISVQAHIQFRPAAPNHGLVQSALPKTGHHNIDDRVLTSAIP
jgi:hypothetical protein